MVNSCLTTIWNNVAEHRSMSMFTSKFEMISLLVALRLVNICHQSVPLPVIWELVSLRSKMHIASCSPRAIFAQSLAVATTRASFLRPRLWLQPRQSSIEIPLLRALTHMMLVDGSSNSPRSLLLLWKPLASGKVPCGQRWRPKTSAKSFRPHPHRAPLGCGTRSLIICAGRGA